MAGTAQAGRLFNYFCLPRNCTTFLLVAIDEKNRSVTSHSAVSTDVAIIAWGFESKQYQQSGLRRHAQLVVVGFRANISDSARALTDSFFRGVMAPSLTPVRPGHERLLDGLL